MRLKRLHIIFIGGLSLVLLSFLWFATNQAMYVIWLIGGLVTTGIAYLFILKRDSSKNKLIQTVILIGAIFINRISERQLIDFSFWTFTTYNEEYLKKANQILQSTAKEIIISRARIYDEDGELSESDVNELKKLQDIMEVNIMAKTESYIYYEIYGFLDNRVGIKYFFQEGEIDEKALRKIKDSWYY